MPRIADRPTGDLVVLGLVFVVGLTILLFGVGVILLGIYRPELDTSPSILLLRDLLSGLVGAIIGYLAGRRVTA